jgi:hypothetical protein
MAIIYENIDPDGDTLIIISYLTVPTQTADGSVPTDEHAAKEAGVADEPIAEQPTVADEPAAIEEVATGDEPTIEEPAVAYEPDCIVNHSIFSKTHGTTHLHEGLRKFSKSFRH